MNRILLITGQSPTGRLLMNTLHGLGFGIDIARDGDSGIRCATHRHYSHILIDSDQSYVKSIQLFCRIAKIQKNAVGVLLTAAANLNTVYSALEAGMRCVIAKPVDFDQLLPFLESKYEMVAHTLSESEIAGLSLSDIQCSLSDAELIDIIRSVDYPFAGKHRLEHFDRDTLERVVHLVSRWCRQRAQREQELTLTAS
ncbi:MAG: response regulator [Planctomycetaceae bacterium]